jgi:hypothetical protein
MRSSQILADVPTELNSAWAKITHNNTNGLHVTGRDQINRDRHSDEDRSRFVPRTVLFCPFYGVPPSRGVGVLGSGDHFGSALDDDPDQKQTTN